MSSSIKTGRQIWIDGAKGLSITLVVVTHMISSLQGSMPIPDLVIEVNKLFLPLRMPLFFLIAGFFAKKALHDQWNTFFDKKLLHFAYFYLLWNSIAIISRVVLSEFSNQEADLSDLWRFLWKPYFSLWFLYGLLLAFLVARITRNVPFVIQIAVASAIAIFITPNPKLLPFIFSSFLKLYPFFLVGCYASTAIRTWVPKQSLLLSLTLLVAFFIGGFFALRLASIYHPAIYFPLAAIGCAGTMVIIYRAQETYAVKLLNFLGERTLAIYLMHFLTVAIARELIIRLNLQDLPITALILIGTILAIVSCLVADAIFKRTWLLSFLVTRPDFFHFPKKQVPATSNNPA